MCRAVYKWGNLFESARLKLGGKEVRVVNQKDTYKLLSIEKGDDIAKNVVLLVMWRRCSWNNS